MFSEALCEIKFLRKEIKIRDERIKILENRLNSQNSSIPPSKDLTKASRKLSLRKKSTRKSGGQPGHNGHHLKFVDHPDRIIEHYINECQMCHSSLSQVDQHFVDSQQVFDIPKIKFNVIEHRQYSVVCPHCRHSQRSKYPFSPSKSKTQYGSNIVAVVSYLNVRHSLPMKRTQELIDVLTGHKISEGTIFNMLKSQCKKLKYTYEQIRIIIEKSIVVGSDETGCTVEGKNHWLWVFQNSLLTFMKISQSRGYKTIEQLFPDGLKLSVLVSDRWAAQLKIPTRENQLCLAHLIRDCNKLIDGHKSKWAKKLKKVLEQIFNLSRQLKLKKEQKENIEIQFDHLFKSPLKNSHADIVKLQSSLKVKRRSLTTCLYERYVPPDNNASERAIRKMKVKEKVSGGFRSKEGAVCYAIIQSIVDTAIKQGIHPFKALNHPHLVLQ
jgi:transposase